jgi:ATP-dependent DNA ligase
MRPQEILALARENRKDTENAVHKVLEYEKANKSKMTWPAIVQRKFDGVYAAFIVSQGEVLIVSRTMRPFQNVQHLSRSPDQFVKPGLQSGVFIAELVSDELTLEELSGALSPNRVEPLSTGMLTKVMRVYPVFHDHISADNWIQGLSTLGYVDRQSLLRFALKADSRYAYYNTVHSETDWLEYAASCIAEGDEGAVRKEPCAPWIAGKKDHQYTKIVRELSLDLECLDVAYGKGKREGVIAKLQFKYPSTGKLFWADLGQGWTDERRMQLTRDFEGQTAGTPIGKVFKVKALQESSKGVMRLPKVEEMRIDKEQADVR